MESFARIANDKNLLIIVGKCSNVDVCGCFRYDSGGNKKSTEIFLRKIKHAFLDRE